MGIIGHRSRFKSPLRTQFLFANVIFQQPANARANLRAESIPRARIRPPASARRTPAVPQSGELEERTEAEAFYSVLGQRLKKFGLELSPEKTRVIPFDRTTYAGRTSFEFLGFEFRWGRDRSGKAHLKRRTARKKLRGSLSRFTEWCRENRHLKRKELFAQLNVKLRGYYNYYGVSGNSASLQEFFTHAMRILMKWLNRRGQRHSYNWTGFRQVLEHFQVIRPRIVGRPRARLEASLA